MRASRLISILMTLQTRGRATAESMAEAFEVSARTIYRDIDELSAAGVPVYADRGRGGGFLLQEGYRTKLTGLTLEESATLLLAGLSGPADDLGLGPALASAERKMLAALPIAQAARASLARQRVLLDPLDWYRRAERPPFLAAVAKALWKQTRIRVRYESWKGRTSKVLEPLGLVIKAGIWYVVARSNEKIGTYRVSQVEWLVELDETFTIPAKFNLATHWTSEIGRFEKQLRRGRALVRVSAGALSRIERLGADAAEAVRASTPDAGGWRTVKIPIEEIEHAAIELLGFGPHVKVLSPATLRHRVGALAQDVADLYQAGDA